ncbi:MAG TPA: pyruvate kinase [Rhodothermales bacterium]|nr:pyruvate kinase [Rhodothermales bacterium]HRR09792.1 pyruvate kinase [Rhodothermales bacterium]
MKRRTKIVCTIGPASQSYEKLTELVAVGMDVARLNFSHGTHDEHWDRIIRIRKVSKDIGKEIAILQDLQGPKIRLGRLLNEEFPISMDEELVLTTEPLEICTKERIYVSYPSLAQEAVIGNIILVDDGNVELEVTEIINHTDLKVRVRAGNALKSRKGVNLPNIAAKQPALTEKDLNDLKFGLEAGVDWVALSFVRAAKDVAYLRESIRTFKPDSQVKIIAKIEKPEAVTNLEEIIAISDGIMVARGDLGIEAKMAELPIVQKKIIRLCLNAAKPVITATQMLESMIHNPRPTRAEASDVANAVWDGTDAIMLSAETASGNYPIETVRVMDEIARTIEASPLISRRASKAIINPSDVTESVSLSACRMAKDMEAKAIVCLTYSGNTAFNIAQHRPEVPIYACTVSPLVVAQLSLLWGAQGVRIPFQHNTDDAIATVQQVLKERGVVVSGDKIVITAGMPIPAKGKTNMVLVKVVD